MLIYLVVKYQYLKSLSLLLLMLLSLIDVRLISILVNKHQITRHALRIQSHQTLEEQVTFKSGAYARNFGA